MNDDNELLADAIRAHADFARSEPCFVSLYNVEQVYGGPEEGGWWHTIWTCEGSVPFVTEDAANAYLESQREAIAQRNREDAPQRAAAYARLPGEDDGGYDAGEGYIPRGWGDTGKTHIVVEREAGMSDNSRSSVPHYE